MIQVHIPPVTLSIDLPASIVAHSTCLTALHTRYAVPADLPADITLHVTVRDLDARGSSTGIGRQEVRQFRMEHGSTFRVALPMSVAAGDLDQMVCEIDLSRTFSRPGVAVLDYVKLLYCLYILRQGGLPLHSAGCVIDGGAVVCMGKSGAGKSTLAGLVQQSVPLLSDELNVILPGTSGAPDMVCATPFARPNDSCTELPDAAPPAALFHLVQDTRNYLAPLPVQLQILRLVSNTYLPCQDRTVGDMVIENARHAAGRLPVADFHFVKDSSVATFLYEQVCEGVR